jgi:hypothetical protein
MACVAKSALYCRFNEFNGFDLFLLHEFGKPEPIIVRIFGKAHAGLPCAEKAAKGWHRMTLCGFRSWCQSRLIRGPGPASQLKGVILEIE